MAAWLRTYAGGAAVGSLHYGALAGIVEQRALGQRDVSLHPSDRDPATAHTTCTVNTSLTRDS